MDRRAYFHATVAGLAMAIAASTAAQAEWNPRRPINVIVPYNAGGGTDSFARALEANAEGALPVPLVVVNKPGSSGITGATAAAGARPDGQTVLMTSSGSFLLTSMLRDTEINPFDSFRVVAQIGKLTSSIMVPASSPHNTLDDLVAALKADPGKLRWGHTGRGGFHQVAVQAFLNANGLEAVDVPFKGGSATRAALIGAQVDFGGIGIQQAAGFEKELRPLALASDKRDAFATEVPTFGELGYEVPLISSPIVVFAPKGTPDDVVSSLEAALKKIAAKPEFAQMMAKRGNAPAFLTGAETLTALKAMQVGATPIIEALK